MLNVNLKFPFTSLVILLLVTTLHSQSFRNLDFKQLCDSSRTGFCYWDLSWGGKATVEPAEIDKQKCLLIKGETETSVGFVEQTVNIDQLNDMQIITISAFVKSEEIIGKGAGLNLGLYDKNGNLISNKDMGGFYSLDWIKGSVDWKEYSISLVCPKETRRIRAGMILYGKGKVWYKNYKVSFSLLEKRKPSNLAIHFINAVCDTIKKHSLYRDSFDIASIKNKALQIAGNAVEYKDCYLAVNYILESLRQYGDHHSFFMKSEEVKNWKEEGSKVSKIILPDFKLIKNCGYINVPAFHGGNQEKILEFADSLQKAIETLFASGVKGWIVDLRKNTGGNMSPMIAGLGPLFSSNKLGSLVNVDGVYSSWYYNNGRYYWDNDTGWVVTKPVVLSKRLPIAVLTSNQTGSSGEAVAISFIRNFKTKSFGQASWGLTTGNGSYDLVDGSQIYLASTIMADRNGNLYKGSIIPDFLLEPDSSERDGVLDKAIKWIKDQK